MCEYNFLQFRSSVIAVAAILNAMWAHNLNDVDFQAIVVGLDLLAADESAALKYCRLELVESFYRTFPEMAPGHWSAGRGGRHSPTSVLDVHLAAAQRQMYTMGSKGVAANANTAPPAGLHVFPEERISCIIRVDHIPTFTTMEDELEIAACGSPIPMTNGKIGYGGSGAAGHGSTAASANTVPPAGLLIDDEPPPTVTAEDELEIAACGSPIPMTNGKIGYGGSGAAGCGSTSPVGIGDQLDPNVEYVRPRASSCEGIIDVTAASPIPMTDCTIDSIGTRGGSTGGDGNSGGGGSSGNEGSGGGTKRSRDADGNYTYAIDAPSETPQHTKLKLTTSAGSSSIDAAQYAPVGRRRDREDRDRFGEGKRTGSPPPSEPSPLSGCTEETGVPGRLSKFHQKLQTMVGIDTFDITTLVDSS